MPVTVLSADTARPELGATFRTQRRGPETDLLDWFLEAHPFRVPSDTRVTIFREPRLESGFPDLVVVFWDAARTKHWREERADLKTEDIRLVHYLLQLGPTSRDTLRRAFTKNVTPNLDRLEAADLVWRLGEEWSPRDLRESFAVTRIAAIEAKVDDWSAALKQAFLNTWFASDSHVLLPEIPKNAGATAEAQALGIGICTRAKPLFTSHTPGQQLPRSYASWLFNEWTWRASLAEPRTRRD
jgi:hypothetical protein